MAIVPSPTVQLSERDELIFSIVGCLDEAFQSDEEVSTLQLAEEIVGLFEACEANSPYGGSQAVHAESAERVLDLMRANAATNR